MIRFPSTLLLILIVCAELSFAQLTLQQYKDNNTAACGGTAAPLYCTAGTFSPMTDNQSVVSGNTILTATFNFGYTTGAAQGNISGPMAGNVAPLAPTTLMPYTDPNAKLFVHFMPWFVAGGTLDHPNVGYSSNNVDTVNGQLADIAARLFSALIIDWYGQAEGPTTVDWTALTEQVSAPSTGPHRRSPPTSGPVAFSSPSWKTRGRGEIWIQR